MQYNKTCFGIIIIQIKHHHRHNHHYNPDQTDGAVISGQGATARSKGWCQHAMNYVNIKLTSSLSSSPPSSPSSPASPSSKVFRKLWPTACRLRFPKCFFSKVYFPKCFFPKFIFQSVFFQMCTQLTHLLGFERLFIYGKANKRLAVVTQTDCAANDIFGICPVAQNWYLVFVQWHKIGIW